MAKRLVYGAIRNLILGREDFDLLIIQMINLLNLRPIAFKEGLRDTANEVQVPLPLTPEMPIFGMELVSLNILPNLPNENDPDFSLSPLDSKISFEKLSKARNHLVEIYNREFLSNLIAQSTDRKGAYKKITHHSLSIGDLVLIKDQFMKPSNYPLARAL